MFQKHITTNRRQSVPLTTTNTAFEQQQNFEQSTKNLQQEITTSVVDIKTPLVPTLSLSNNESLLGAKFKCKRIKAAKQINELLTVVEQQQTTSLTKQQKAHLFSSYFKSKGMIFSQRLSI